MADHLQGGNEPDPEFTGDFSSDSDDDKKQKPTPKNGPSDDKSNRNTETAFIEVKKSRVNTESERRPTGMKKKSPSKIELEHKKYTSRATSQSESQFDKKNEKMKKEM